MHKSLLSPLQNENGQSLAETALILPLLLFLVLATVDIGRGFRTYMVLTNGARETARWLTSRPTEQAGALPRALEEAGRIGLTDADLTISISPTLPEEGSNYSAGELVTVSIEHNYQVLFGLFTQLPDLPIRTQATMVMLY